MTIQLEIGLMQSVSCPWSEQERPDNQTYIRFDKHPCNCSDKYHTGNYYYSHSDNHFHNHPALQKHQNP